MSPKWVTHMFSKFIGILIFCALFLGVSASTSGAAHAQTLKPHVPHWVDDHPCLGFFSNGGTDFYCNPSNYPRTAPTGPSCPPPPFYNGGTDDLGHKTDYTFSNNATSCVTVDYDNPLGFVNGRTNCQIWFYVPLGALWNGNIVFGYDDGNNVHHIGGTVNENTSPGGWQYVFTARDVHRVSWSDNNGQPVGAARLAWSVDPDLGIERECTA